MSKAGQVGNMVIYRPGGDCDKLENKVSTDGCTVGSSRIYFFHQLGNWSF